MMCTIYQHWVYTPIQGINLASIHTSALCVSQGFFKLFVKLGHKNCWHFTESIKICYVSSIYSFITIEGTRVESRWIDSFPHPATLEFWIPYSREQKHVSISDTPMLLIEINSISSMGCQK